MLLIGFTKAIAMNLKRTPAAFGLAMLAAAAARAAPPACMARIDGLAQQARSVAGQHRRAVLEHDLRQARKEAAEGDEEECAEILGHPDEVLQQAD